MTEGTATLTSALEGSRQRLDLASPREIVGLSHLELVARHIVEGFLIGLHNSPKRGFSAEFAEDRPYNRGDDLRHLDWRAYARTDRLFIKQYEEETNLRAYLLVDVSRSMGWVSDADRLPTKLAYARLLAASLSLLLVQQGDATGLIAFDETLRASSRASRPRGGPTRARRSRTSPAACSGAASWCSSPTSWWTPKRRVCRCVT